MDMCENLWLMSIGKKDFNTSWCHFKNKFFFSLAEEIQPPIACEGLILLEIQSPSNYVRRSYSQEENIVGNFVEEDFFLITNDWRKLIS